MDRIINHFGEWTLIFIFLTLSMTPLRKITKSLEWIKFRRMLGLFAFFYASVHMLSYVGLDYRFDFEPLINDVLKKKFIFIGFSAWLLLIPLAVTSSQKMVRLLKQNWKKIHKLIYVIAIFGVLHFFNKSSWDRFEYGNSKGRIQTIQKNLKNSHQGRSL